MKIRKLLFMSALVTLALVYGGIAQAANTVSGSLWHVPEAVVTYGGTGGSPASVPGTTPDVKFDVNSPFNFFGTDVTVGMWLGNGSAFNIAENTVGTLATAMDGNGLGTIVEFKGFVSVTNGQQFTVAHDDGLTLIIGGLDLGFDPGPTAPTVTTKTYTGPSGNFAFELVYAECCGGPAVLQVDLPFSATPVPEPATGFLLITGVLGLLGYGWRKR